MRTRWIPPLLACALVLAAGCGGGKIDSHEEGIDAKMDLIDDIVDVLETIRDKESAEAAKPRLEALDKRMKEIDSQMNALGPPKGEKMFDEDMMNRMGEAMEKLMTALSKIPDDPEIHEVLGNTGMALGR